MDLSASVEIIGFPSEKVISEFVPFLAKAVQQMRSENIVHFSLKAKNSLQCGGVWKVVDFDAAEIMKDGETRDISGSYGFTDPDVYEYDRASYQSDLYSVGVLHRVYTSGGGGINYFGIGEVLS